MYFFSTKIISNTKFKELQNFEEFEKLQKLIIGCMQVKVLINKFIILKLIEKFYFDT